MNIIDLAKQANIGDAFMRVPHPGVMEQLETFARLVIEAHVKGVDMENIGFVHYQGDHYEVAERPLEDGEKNRGWTQEELYTATQMAAQRQRALDEAAGVCDAEASVEGIAQKCAAAIRALGVKNV